MSRKENTMRTINTNINMNKTARKAVETDIDMTYIERGIDELS